MQPHLLRLPRQGVIAEQFQIVGGQWRGGKPYRKLFQIRIIGRKPSVARLMNQMHLLHRQAVIRADLNRELIHIQPPTVGHMPPAQTPLNGFNGGTRLLLRHRADSGNTRHAADAQPGNGKIGLRPRHLRADKTQPHRAAQLPAINQRHAFSAIDTLDLGGAAAQTGPQTGAAEIAQTFLHGGQSPIVGADEHRGFQRFIQPPLRTHLHRGSAKIWHRQRAR